MKTSPRRPVVESARRVARSVAVEALEGRRLLHGAVIDAIGSQSVPVGKTLQIPITASYDHSDKLTYTVSDNSAAVVATLRPATNTWIEMDVDGFGTMKFQLFDDLTPKTVRRITGLINAGFYDGLTFHRVIDDFIIQGGDPQGNGSGGPEFTFDDEFNTNTQFTGDGQLAMANSGKDTNGSQFFITEGTARFLDFNHNIFGQLVRGKSVRDGISEVPTSQSGVPQANVVISRVRVVENKTDAVLQVRLSSNTTGTVTVTATGEEGTTSRSFSVAGVTDTDPNADTPPILTSLTPVYYTPVATTITIPFKSADIEGSAVEYPVQYASAADQQIGATIDYNANRTAIIVTPPAGYSGPINFYIGAKVPGATSRGSSSSNPNAPLSGIADSQLITIAVGEKSASATAVEAIDAPAGTNTGDVLVASFKDNDNTAKTGNWTASIDWGDNTITTGTIVKTSAGRFEVYGNHAYRRAGTFPVRVQLYGNLGAYTEADTGYVTARDYSKLVGSTVSVMGGAGADVIGISRKGTKLNVNVNGTIKQYNASQVTRLDILGYAGDDVVTLGGRVPASYLFGGDGDDILNGGDFNDTLTGGAGKNTMYGNGGDDRINGSGGRDFSYGGEGDDRIYGNGGDDVLDGGGNVDRLWGGAGADLLDGTFGIDTADNDSADTRIAIEVLQ